MIRYLSFSIAFVLGAAQPSPAEARDVIHIVGSSTVYPFATVVGERFGRSAKYKAPTIESTGSGGGLKLFCAGVGPDTPDIANASRRIKKSEVERCRANGVKEIVEVKIGYDGIVIANSLKSGKPLNLTRRQLYLALAKDVPVGRGQRFVANPHRTWRQVDSSLPNVPIRVLGPPPTSGTRDAFAELALQKGCETFNWIKALPKKTRKARCRAVREDGAWVEAGENDNLIVQKLVADSRAFGVFGFSFLKENADKVQGSLIEGAAPNFSNISDGSYSVSRGLYFYIKKAHVGSIKGLKRYAKFFVHRRAVGDNGYLSARGLIPLSAAELEAQKRAIDDLAPLQL